MAFELPTLPYAKSALGAKGMCEETLDLHHGKHHQAYVTALNGFVEKDPSLQGKSLDEIVKSTAAAGGPVFNNAGQHWNHSFFWQCLTPDGGGQPTGDLKRQIEKDFGDVAAFQKEFADKAVKQFGSGWAWLVLEGDKLKVVTTGNAELPMLQGQQAILTCDVWEHAYYLDYQNRRPDFVQAFLDHLVDWEFVARNLSSKMAAE